MLRSAPTGEIRSAAVPPRIGPGAARGRVAAGWYVASDIAGPGMLGSVGGIMLGWMLWIACTGVVEAPAVDVPAPPAAEAKPPAREEAPPVADPEPAAPWSVGKLEGKHDGAVAVLGAVRTGRHEGYDRVVFELDRIPGWEVEYVDRPVTACGSGEAVPVAGDAWLEVRMTSAAAHTEAGAPTVKDRDRKLDLGVARQLVGTCDFEGHVTWVLGVSNPGRFRAFELADPPRLVVDVQAP